MATIVLQVAASTDDARNINGGTSKVTNATTQHIGKFSTTDYWNGFRWENVGIPQGATINFAYLNLYSAQIASGSTAKAIFYGVAEDNAATFNTSTEYPEGKPRTTASVAKDFNVSSWSSNPGFGVELVDVTAIVQEIISRPGWQRGNALAIVCHDNGSANNNYIGFSTYDRASDRGAKLFIDYTAPPSPTVSLDTPDKHVFNTPTPKLEFTGTDPDGDDITYEVEITEVA